MRRLLRIAVGFVLGMVTTSQVLAGGCEPGWLHTVGHGDFFFGQVNAAVEHDDGTGPALYAGGHFTHPPAVRVAKWDEGDWTPLTGGDPIGPVHALAVFDGGTGPELYAGATNGLYRWTGSAWVAVGGATFGAVRALAVFDDGTGPALYAGGAFEIIGGVSARRIVQWDGTTLSALGTGMNFTVRALTVFDDGSGSALYAGGRFTTAGGVQVNRVARWDGTSWSALNVGVNDLVTALIGFDDGNGPALYAGGRFTGGGGFSASRVARWDGTSWSGLGAGVDGEVRALEAFDHGSGLELHVGGLFQTAGGSPIPTLAKWDGTQWGGLDGPFGTPVYGMTVFDHGTGPELHVVGSLNDPPIIDQRGYVARLSGGWRPVGVGLGGAARHVTLFDDGSGPSLCVLGVISFAGAAFVNRAVRWDVTGVSSLGPGFGPEPSKAGAFGGELYSVGSFTIAGGAPASGIARWDGNAWSEVGGGLAAPGRALAVFDDGAGAGPRLYVGGEFQSAGGVPANYIATWDGTTWSSVAPGGSGGTDGFVHELWVLDDGSGPALYAAGDFQTAGGVPANRIARWNGTSWSPLGSGIECCVLGLAVFDDGNGPALYAGGNFSSAGGMPNTQRLARWDGSAWSSVGFGSSGTIAELLVFDDGANGEQLYLGGTFLSAGGVPARNLARWDGTSWSEVGGGLNDDVNHLTLLEDAAHGGPALVVAGRFTDADVTGDSYLTRWGCSVDLPISYCFGDGTGEPCPCGNTGDPGHGCNIPQGLGGIEMTVEDWNPDFAGGGTATFVGRNFRPMSEAGSQLIRSTLAQSPATVFGDGLLCVQPPVVRLNATLSSGGISMHPTMHGAGAGTFYYQLWVRSNPIMFCDPLAAWNLSNGIELTWP